MDMRYIAEFDKLDWESPIQGVRHKCFQQDGLRLRLVEYSREMPLHWCEKGHWGYLIEGRMEIEFDNTKSLYKPGDGIFIPDGHEHRHRGKVVSDKALVFFVEKI